MRVREERRELRRQTGFTLLELMIAVTVLAIGLGGLSILFFSAAASNTKNSRNTSATMAAQLVLDTIRAQPANAPATITITDCASNQWQVNTTAGASPSGAGATLVTSQSSFYYGGIDPTEDYNSVPPATSGTPGYAMKYVECGATGQPVVYDVRWNVMAIDSYTNLITVSARQSSQATTLGTTFYALPVTLRGIQGS